MSQHVHTSECATACTPNHVCEGHAPDHKHGPDCGHEAVPHGDHIDYVVDNHLHHAHDTHCDNHGILKAE